MKRFTSRVGYVDTNFSKPGTVVVFTDMTPGEITPTDRKVIVLDYAEWEALGEARALLGEARKVA